MRWWRYCRQWRLLCWSVYGGFRRHWQRGWDWGIISMRDVGRNPRDYLSFASNMYNKMFWNCQSNKQTVRDWGDAEKYNSVVRRTGMVEVSKHLATFMVRWCCHILTHAHRMENVFHRNAATKSYCPHSDAIIAMWACTFDCHKHFSSAFQVEGFLERQPFEWALFIKRDTTTADWSAKCSEGSANEGWAIDERR